jgi:hypothetical protein
VKGGEGIDDDNDDDNNHGRKVVYLVRSGRLPRSCS